MHRPPQSLLLQLLRGQTSVFQRERGIFGNRPQQDLLRLSRIQTRTHQRRVIFRCVPRVNERGLCEFCVEGILVVARGQHATASRALGAAKVALVSLALEPRSRLNTEHLSGPSLRELPAPTLSTEHLVGIRHPAAHVFGGQSVHVAIQLVLHVAMPCPLQEGAQPRVFASHFLGQLKALSNRVGASRPEELQDPLGRR